MSHNLLLLRHGKSSHKDKSLADFDRPLNKRGQRDCKSMGRWLQEEGPLPDLLISSPAKRARQTAKRICKMSGMDPTTVQWEDSIYNANVRALFKVLQGIPEDTQTVMLVGHHKGLESMILRLSEWADIPARPKLIPTAAIAWLKVQGPWQDIKRCDARLKSIIRPRDLLTPK